MIACLDVNYKDAHARAAGVVLESWTQHTASATYFTDLTDVHPYEPGGFFRRELPCPLAVLRLLSALPRVLIVDGYVWTSPERKPGLGAHLHEALSRKSIVVGVAKTEFIALAHSPLVQLVYRGSSRAPLFVTSIGFGPQEAGTLVSSMYGDHRIPDALRVVDRLARSNVPTSQ